MWCFWLACKIGASRVVYGSIHRLDKVVLSGVLIIEASRNGHWIILAFLYYSPAGNIHHRVSLLIIISCNFLSSFYLFIYQPF